MKLEGTIDTFPLRELIEMIFYSSVTGALHLHIANSHGQIYFRDGQIYHAALHEQTGMSAMAGLFGLDHATFSFLSDAVIETETIWGEHEHNLQTAERLARRWREVRSYVPSLDLIPEILLSSDAALRRVGPSHSTILAAIDGKSSLADITASIGWTEIDVAEAIAQMSLDGVVNLRREQQREHHCKEAPPTGVAQHTCEGGLFDRFLSRTSKARPQPEPVLNDGSRLSGEELTLRLLRS